MKNTSKNRLDEKVLHTVRKLQKNGIVNARLVAFVLGMDDRWNTVEMMMWKLAEKGKLSKVKNNEFAFMSFR
jgi:hypothetical protein